MPFCRQSTINQARAHILSGPPPPRSAGGKWIVRPDINEARQVLGRSFAGKPPPDPAPGNPFLEWGASHFTYPDQEAKVRTATYLVSVPLLEDYHNGALILCRSAPNCERGDIVAVASVLEFDPSLENEDTKSGWWSNIIPKLRKIAVDRSIQRHLADEVPELYTSEAYKDDLQKFVRKLVGGVVAHLPSWHREHGPRGKHWWVHDVGVHPDHQGRGIGKSLMSRLNEAADIVGMACYLYCAGERNKGFYESVGYSVAGRKVVKDPTKEEDGEPISIYLMTRESKLN